MSVSRLNHALDAGALVLPEGPVAVFAPPADYDLSAIGPDRARIVSHDVTQTEVWRRSGYAVARAAEPGAAGALVVLPRAKPFARALVAEARAATDGPIIIDGTKTDGVDSLLKALRREAGAEVGTVTSKAHGKVFTIFGGDVSGWAAADRHVAGDFVTRPGVFSADGPDKGSEALRAALPQVLGGRVVDLGAGWGFLSRAILERPGVTTLDLVEADGIALDCARRNVTDPRARFHWADATLFKPERPVDAVVTNPPFHTGRTGDPEIGRAFLRAAAAMLAPTGTLWMVANRHLPYEAALSGLFREIAEEPGTGGFKIIRAQKPLRANG